MTIVSQLFDKGSSSGSNSAVEDVDDYVERPEEAGGIKGALARAKRTVVDSSAYKSASNALAVTKSWSWWGTKKAGGWAWILGTTFLVVALPLIIEVEREQQLVEMEAQQIQQLRAQGYSPQQIQQMQAQGALGVPPPPPGQQ